MGATTPKRALLEMDSSLKTNAPLFEGKFDRYCRNCGLVIEKAALRKFAGQRCPHCTAFVEGRKEEVRLWDPCVECDTCLMCFMRFCNMCGLENVHYDPNKPSRFEAIMRSRIRSEIRAETKEEEEKLMAAAEEAEEMESQKSAGDQKGKSPKGGASAQKPEGKAEKDVKAQTSQGTAQKPARKAEKDVKAQSSQETAQQSEGKGNEKEDKEAKKQVEKAALNHQKPEGEPKMMNRVGINPENDTDEMETDE